MSHGPASASREGGSWAADPGKFSIDAVAQHADVSRATVYYQFHSKAGLLEALFDSPEDPRALIMRHDFGAGRVWGTTSISLVALSPVHLRYDFTPSPGDPSAWRPVPVTEPS